MNENLLIKAPLASELFALIKDLPVIDWHNHLSISDIASNKSFANMAELWVKSDPYKHRAMRICGVPEKYITGEASDYEKFQAWAGTLPRLIGNPLYHWSELELKRIFNIDEQLNEKTAAAIWEKANECLKQPKCSACGLLDTFNVEYAAPCVQLCEDLTPFTSIRKGIVPSLRGDDIVACNSDFIGKLQSTTGISIQDWDSLAKAISQRIEALHAANCRYADHALDDGFAYVASDGKEQQRFTQLLEGTLPQNETSALASAILRLLAAEYASHGWTMQLHIGARRQTSTRLRTLAGPAGGYAGIGHTCDIRSITSMLDDFEKAPSGLSRVILYTLNPADNAALTVLTGSYSQDGVVAKVQAGPAWWFCDHLFGMQQCFENYSAYGVLSTFVGMTTDSRSLLSFVRHEYFRRVFCAWLAEKADKGEVPDDFDALASIATAVSYGNPKSIIP
ncbi:MAG: glucuronate isomerase [Victivallales bacterium]|nr:glucuronate isomerase [Victivallales bacterium]